MLDFVKQIKDFLSFGASLSFLPKVMLTVIIIVVGAFMISTLWMETSKVSEADNKNTNSNEKFVKDLQVLIDKGDVFAIKSALINSEYTKKLNRSYGAVSLYTLHDFSVDGYVFDFAIVPDGNYYGQAVLYATLVKLLNTKRSPVSAESQQEIDKIELIEGGNSFRSKVTETLNGREDYRRNTPIHFYGQRLIIGGQKDLMSKKEIEKVASINAKNRDNGIVTYNTLVDLLK